jgi:glycosyltransferase involved in cell wall biosynthesis
MHDNRLAAALRARGRDVVLVPLYTPLRTDEIDVSESRVFYGGVNAYLQHKSALFRHTPWVVDRLFDAPWLLRAAGKQAGAARPEKLGAMTLSILQGERGMQRKELAKLVDGLRRLRPAVVYLPNLMFAGLARSLKVGLGVPVLCGLTGEDIFIDRLTEPYHSAVLAVIRECGQDIDAYVALTDYYARHAVEHFGLPAERVHRIPLGIHVAEFAGPRPPAAGPPTIGYLARVCPEKGLHLLAEALPMLRAVGHACRVRAAGYLGSADRDYLAQLTGRLREGGFDEVAFEYVGEVTQAEKIEFLRQVDVLAVPTTYAEAKGFYALEALAAGVPLVLPGHGAFQELIAATGGGLLHEPGDAASLAAALGELLADGERRTAMAARGQQAAMAQYDAAHMAEQAWALFERFV